MEKLAETKKRKDNGAAAEPKRRRSSSDTIQYMQEKSESEASLKEKELQIERGRQTEGKKKTAWNPSATYATAVATTTRATTATAAASNYVGTTEPTNDYSFGKICAKEVKATQYLLIKGLIISYSPYA